MKAYLEDKLPRIESSLQRFYDRLGSNELLIELAPNGSINLDTFRKALCEPLEEAVLATGGKRVRPVLTYLAHDIVGGSFEQIDDVAILPELAHKGSIVIDDIEDGEQKRDGRDPLYKSYGMATALNAGNFLYFIPELILEGIEIDKERKLEILQDYLDMGLIAHIGQGSDIYWRDKMILPTEDEYLQMCAYKASSLKFAAKLGAILGNGSKEQKIILLEIAEMTGTAYQLKDDLLSLDENAHDYGDDIIIGKISLMVLRTLQKENKDAERLKNILFSKAGNPEEAIQILRNNGSIEYTEQTSKKLVDKAVQKLSQGFPESRYRRILSEFIEYCGISREK